MLMQAHDNMLVLEEENSSIRAELDRVEKRLREKTELLDLLQKEIIGV